MDPLTVPSGCNGTVVAGVECSLLPLGGGKSRFGFEVLRWHLRARGSVIDRCKQKSGFPMSWLTSGGLQCSVWCLVGVG